MCTFKVHKICQFSACSWQTEWLDSGDVSYLMHACPTDLVYSWYDKSHCLKHITYTIVKLPIVIVSSYLHAVAVSEFQKSSIILEYTVHQLAQVQYRDATHLYYTYIATMSLYSLAILLCKKIPCSCLIVHVHKV